MTCRSLLPNQARTPTARVLAKSELKTPRAKTAPADTKSPKKRDAAAPATMSLRDKLVAYRKRVADGKPAFCVFDNKTIDAIVDAKPTSVAAFGRVAGIGPTKREKYGEDVVRICTEHGGGAVGKPLGPSKPRKRAAQPTNGGALEGFFAPRGKKAKI